MIVAFVDAPLKMLPDQSAFVAAIGTVERAEIDEQRLDEHLYHW